MAHTEKDSDASNGNNDNTPLTKQDLKEVAQGLFLQVQEFKEKPKGTELSRPALNHQFIHNKSVLEKVSKAREMLQDFEGIELIDYLLKEAISEIKERNKKLLVADSTSGGWATVREMERGRIFEGDDEETKLMRQAEKTVMERRRNRPFPYRRNRPFQSAGGSGFGQRAFRVTQASPYDVCRQCGSLGHWRRNCPQLYPAYIPQAQNQQFPAHMPIAAIPGITGAGAPGQISFGKKF